MFTTYSDEVTLEGVPRKLASKTLSVEEPEGPKQKTTLMEQQAPILGERIHKCIVKDEGEI